MRNFTITVNGVSYQVTVEENTAAPGAVSAPVSSAPAAPSAAPSAVPSAEGGTKITAPIPGTILDIRFGVGDQVKRGDILCILEAMKMENEICAPADGRVASVNISKGSSVESGALLMTIS
ncbi:MAG: acetyl-CoA carboxylase biotin carboxyl carrier protein subunit [Clostridia bacterium]|nr:acetyl-CoA carboxylase biotin carboxyl carrier protein subunit [Clostridia bacterium]